MRMGSDFYTAPEIVGDLKKASIQSDIFSLGCILHDFIGDERRIPNYEIVERGPYSPILRGCTRKDPARRFKSVAAVRDALLSIGDTSKPVTPEGSTIQDLLSKTIHPSEQEWNKIIDFIDDKFDNEDSLNALRKISLDHINGIVKNIPLLSRLGSIYARWIRDRNFVFAECDALAIRLLVFVEHCDLDVQAECLMAMLYMGTKHNRWYVENKFVDQIKKDMNEDLAKRLAVDIRVDDTKACKAFDHLKTSISYDKKNAHPLIQKALKEICKMNFSIFKYTDKGPRIENQDAIEIREFGNRLIVCIADGVGGANCGSLASSESIRYFLEQLEGKGFDLYETIHLTHERIKFLQVEDPRCSGMATTFTSCIVEDKTLKGIHSGDSRLCILRGNGIKQLTTPHTEAHRLLVAGRIKEKDINTYPRKNILESALGIKGNLLVQDYKFDLMDGDRIILTTDGVHDVISKVEFRDMSKASGSVEDFGEAIVKALSQAKLTDNVSFIVLQLDASAHS